MTTPAGPPRRSRWWLLAAAALALLSAGLLSFVEGRVEGPAQPERRAVRFPSHMREAEWKRQQARQTLELPAPPPAADPGRGQGRPAPRTPSEPARRDPFLVSLPVKAGEPVVVFEANALRHSRLGELFVACALAEDPRAFSDVQRETGVDPLKDIDRVGFVGRSVVVSGFFDRARWDRLVEDGKASVAPYGDAGRLYRGADGGGQVLAAWRDQLVVMSPDESAARQAIDQLEGRAPAPEAAIPEDQAYGEVYGVIPGAAVQRLFSAGDRALGERIAAAASRVELHVDAMEDVAAVVHVDGEDRAALGELARALGGALSAGRLQATARADQPLTELLDAARVVDRGGRLVLELALPAATVERWFEGCAGRRQAAAPEAEPPPGPPR